MTRSFRHADRLDDETERIATIIVDCIFRVHAELGAGLLESAYVICLYHELISRGVRLESGYRIDLLVEDRIVIECKSVLKMEPVYASQIKTHLKLMNLQLGLLVNFNVDYIKDGLERVVLTRGRGAAH
jgi:hypothetical protein